MQRLYLFFVLIVILSMNSSCEKANDKMLFDKLRSWDSMIDSIPYAVSDSLQLMDYYDLSRSNRAYYNLLKVISDDKTYVNFSNDSTINSVAIYYKGHDPQNSNYIRALAYQGIVRTRMGVKDSTVYEPLREADRLLKSMPESDPSLGYLINYFLGNVHYNNRNYSSASQYFQTALNYANEEDDSTHVFDTYLAFFWNEMQHKNLDKSKLYLDSLSSFYNYLPEKDYYILNTQSIYYEAIGEPEQALEREKEQLKIFHRQKEVIDISRLYFNISDRYSGLGQLDSAMFYAQTSIDMIEDSNYRLNHLYYQNVADIAEKQGNYLVANNYRKQAAELYKNSVEDRLDTQITEIEKKYDLTESENRVLLAHQQSMKIIIAALTLIIILIVILTNVYRVRRNTKMELLVAENRLHQQELQTEIMEEEADKRKWLLQLYSNISDRLTFLQDEFEKLTQRYVSSQPKVYKDMQEILKNADTDLRDINKTLTPDANTFYLYTKLSDDNGILNDKEKLMLMLLSCDADNRELATFMNTTIESIRVRKSQLKKKMCENNMDVSVFGD
jgi:tetratricopeptide (TPR) repeat protein